MNFKLSLVATSLTSILLLSGCGGGDSDSQSIEDKIKDAISDNETIEITGSIAVKVIDGYLSNAEICVDKNTNNICEDDEILDTLTDENGQLEISEENRQYPLIANVIAGKSSDSDRVGKSLTSYSMVATAGKEVITPFTTLANIQNLTLDELAAKYNLDSSVISGDYIEAKQSDETKESAIKAHALARSIVTQLDETITETSENIETINTNIEKVSVEIDNLINDDKIDIVDNSDFELNNGTVSQVKIINNLKEYLENGSEWTVLSQYSSYIETFIDGKNKYRNTLSNDEHIDLYHVVENTLYYQSPLEEQLSYNTSDPYNYYFKFNYISNAFSLVTSPYLWAHIPSNIPETTPLTIEKEHLVNKEHYFIFNDNDNGIDKSLVQLVFNDNGTISSIENNTSEDGSWSIVKYTLPNSDKQIQALRFEYPGEDNKVDNWVLLARNNDALVFGSYTTDITYDNELNDGIEKTRLHLQGFSFHDKNTATSIFNQWKYGETLINNDLKKHLENDQYWYSASFNKSKYDEERNLSKLAFKDGEVLSFDNDGTNSKISYEIEDNQILYPTLEDTDYNIYNSDLFDLRIASGVYDLILNTTTNINEYQKVDLTAEDFTNQSWFYVFDDSNDQNIEPNKLTFKYGENGKLTVNNKDLGDSWDIKDGKLIGISGDNGQPYEYFAILKDEKSMILGSEKDGELFIEFALFKDQETADAIYHKWDSLTPEYSQYSQYSQSNKH
ncbi:hypothetical protein [Photobacterium leiognathi]|uniref:hypothetical protein n=1 Tax=Photobacterium leiognathi TaxID=553611 RepID=UPI002980A62F|nr:hypothetical protein [Photobacterium leiognathi]